jgi:hypothetical protein
MPTWKLFRKLEVRGQIAEVKTPMRDVLTSAIRPLTSSQETISMNVTFATTSISPPAPSIPAKASLKNEKAARDFEAMLLSPVLDALQKTFAGDSEDSKTPGASDYRAMATQALAQSIAARGGIGIARLILRHLEQV